MVTTDENRNWVESFKNALLKIEPQINEGQRKMLFGHYAAPDMALSVKRLAEIAGYQGHGHGAGSLHYGKLARKISEAIGEPPHGDMISVIAQWRGDLKDERGHGQWILYDEVARALEELGWVQTESCAPKADLTTPHGIEKPKEIISQTTQRERDPLIRAWVFQQANGHCECCKQKAPFESDDNFPFLEVHHVVQLSEGGSDRVSNAVALCPNCHRELHYGKHRADLVLNLYKTVVRLVQE